MTITQIKAAILKAWLDKKETILIDVREPVEHKAERIAEAILLPLTTFSQEKDKIKALIENNPQKKIAFHCKAGKRSFNACEKMLREDPSLDLFSLEGGLTAWIEAGYPIDKN